MATMLTTLTADECRDAAYGNAASGQTLRETLRMFAADGVTLTAADRRAVLEGHEAGVMDLVSWLRDMAERESPEFADVY